MGPRVKSELLHEGRGVAVDCEGDTAWLCHEYDARPEDIEEALAACREAGYDHTVDDYFTDAGDIVLVLKATPQPLVCLKEPV